MTQNLQIKLEDLHKLFEVDTINHRREMVVLTGRKGMDLFNSTLEKANNRDYVSFLHDKSLIDSKQKDTLLMMIDSPDEENYEVAKMILKQIQANHVSNL